MSDLPPLDDSPPVEPHPEGPKPDVSGSPDRAFQRVMNPPELVCA